MCPFPSANPETGNNPEIYVFTDYRVLLVLADENEHQIWILQVEKHEMKEKKYYFFRCIKVK